jgi:hypothetical protein
MSEKDERVAESFDARGAEIMKVAKIEREVS